MEVVESSEEVVECICGVGPDKKDVVYVASYFKGLVSLCPKEVV